MHCRATGITPAPSRYNLPRRRAGALRTPAAASARYAAASSRKAAYHFSAGVPCTAAARHSAPDFTQTSIHQTLV